VKLLSEMRSLLRASRVPYVMLQSLASLGGNPRPFGEYGATGLSSRATRWRGNPPRVTPCYDLLAWISVPRSVHRNIAGSFRQTKDEENQT